MSGHEPEKAGHCLCLLLIRLDNLLLRSTRFLRFPPPRRRQAANWPPIFIPPSLASTEWRSGGLPGTRAMATYRVLLFLTAGYARARAPASWSWRQRAAGGVPLISFICSCDSTSKRALERARSGAADVPRLLLRQYVQESFGAPGGHGWSGANRRKGSEENKCGSLAMAGSWGSS